MTEVKKTYKHYVDGKFVRSESGKVYAIDLKNEKYSSIDTNAHFFRLIEFPI